MRRKMIRMIGAALTAMILCGQTAYANVGDMGFFGGISEGRRLPKTTETLLSQTSKTNARSSTTTLAYKEVIFLSGAAAEFEGLIDISASGAVSDTVDVGTYTETYRVYASATSPEDVDLTRNITFNVNYRREGQQIIKDYEVRNWTESVTTPDGTFELDRDQSYFGISIIEDHTPGVVYYKGNSSVYGVYSGGEGDGVTTWERSDSFYGYNNAWSSAETHRSDDVISTADWQMQVQVRPNVTMSKLLQYSQNEPTAISFDGNYREVMQNQSGLKYDIFVKPKQLYAQPDTGGATVATRNTFEQLIAPDVSYLKGHFAETDIKRLFSMQVLDGDAKFYQPSQAITRGQYVTALAKAIKLPIEQVTTTKARSKKQVVNIVFPDVQPDRKEYPYIIAAYKSGLAVGRDNGNFYFDSPIERQEAFVILLRTLGLENLGLDPTPVTSYVDDEKIANWAKREIYAATRIELISADEDGNIRPTDYVSKAEAAALINRLIDYMRSGIATDYADHIVNYAN